MLRTLTLSGLLQFVQHGTTAQCFVVSVISFASFGLQQWLRPYREHESNVLKALVDKQLLFLTFLISFILRVLPEINSAKPVHEEFYGYLAVHDDCHRAAVSDLVSADAFTADRPPGTAADGLSRSASPSTALESDQQPEPEPEPAAFSSGSE